MKIDEIRIAKKRFRKDMGDISLFVESIRSNGRLHPVVVTQNRDVVSGHRRLEALRRLSIEDVPVHLVDTEKLTMLEYGEIDENCIRKDFTVGEITEIDEFVRPLVEAAAAERRRVDKRVARGRPCHSKKGIWY